MALDDIRISNAKSCRKAAELKRKVFFVLHYSGFSSTNITLCLTHENHLLFNYKSERTRVKLS